MRNVPSSPFRVCHRSIFTSPDAWVLTTDLGYYWPTTPTHAVVSRLLSAEATLYVADTSIRKTTLRVIKAYLSRCVYGRYYLPCVGFKDRKDMSKGPQHICAIYLCSCVLVL